MEDEFQTPDLGGCDPTLAEALISRVFDPGKALWTLHGPLGTLSLIVPRLVDRSCW